MLHADFLRFLGFKGTRAQAVRQPAGYTRTTGPYGEVVDCDTLRCCHCSFSWEVVAGSGVQRGFCTRCMGYTCGSPSCMVCIPYFQRLDNVEHGRPALTPPPATVLVPGSALTRPRA